jgi:hypothetical protein
VAQFMLLIRGGEHEELSAEQMQKIVEQYIAWANRLRKEGKFVGGEELKDGGRVLKMNNGAIVDGPFTESQGGRGGLLHDRGRWLQRSC